MKRGKVIYLIVMGFLIYEGEALAGTLPYTFTAGTTARAAEVNANFDALESRLTTLENMESGSTTSDGSADKSPQAPDTSTCSTGSCIIGSASYTYPSGNWVYVARYTPQTEGVLTVTSGPALVCNENVLFDTQIEVSISIAEATSFLPSNPALGGK